MGYEMRCEECGETFTTNDKTFEICPHCGWDNHEGRCENCGDNNDSYYGFFCSEDCYNEYYGIDPEEEEE